jgi:alpha-1,6-mannosyltransferase
VAAGFLAVPDARRHLASFLVLCGVGALLALAAARSLSASSPGFLLLCGALFRATLLFRAPDLSDDWMRFLWDGRVAGAGISPYAFAPSDPALAGVDPALRERVPHAGVRTVYPPVAQAVFRLAAALGSGPLALKVVFALADLSIVALILALGGAGARSAAALYAFHPLAIFQSAGEGHLDSLGVALLLASLVFLERGRAARGGVALALSILTKYVSAFAALPLLRRGRSRLAAATVAAAVPIWLAWRRGGVWPVGGLSEYATRWEFNAFAYPPLLRLFAWLDLPAHAKALFEMVKAQSGHPSWMQALYPYFYAGFFARAALAIALLAALVAIGTRVRDTEAAVFASLSAVLLASPTLHPWYLLWVLPFAARRREPAFLYLSFAVVLSYGLLYPVRWLPPWLILTLEYGPFLVLLTRTLLRARAPRSPAAA